jgi:Kef-type K+ transport system membrane component KefB
MENVWPEAALWLGFAFLSAIISIRVAVSVALIEIMVGAVAGNLVGLTLTDWVNFLAGFGAILLTFLAGTEIDARVVRRHFWSSMTIGVVGFLAPYIGVLLYARYAVGWSWPEAQIAACFVNDLGTVLALGIVFAHYDATLFLFGGATALTLWLLWRFAPRFFKRCRHRVSEPEMKFVLLVLFGLGGLAAAARSEAVLPAYLVGMALAPIFLADPDLSRRTRVVAFTVLTPFYFLKAGSLVDVYAVLVSFGLITVFLAVKMATKFVGILPLTLYHRFDRREGMYTTLMMSTGLTFGTISALFGLTNGIIDQTKYTILVTAVIGSAVVPTLIAQTWFQPAFKSVADSPEPPIEVAKESGNV